MAYKVCDNYHEIIKLVNEGWEMKWHNDVCRYILHAGASYIVCNRRSAKSAIKHGKLNDPAK